MKPTQSEETKMAIMSLNIENIKISILEIKSDVKGLRGVYATKEELQQVTDRVIAIDILTARVSALEANKSFLQGGWKTIGIITGALIAIVALVLNAIRLYRAGL